MNTTIQSLHFTARPELIEFTKEETAKLAHLNSAILSADVTLKLENSDTRDNKVCEIRLSIPGNDLFAKRQCATFEEAVKQVINALRQQLEHAKA